MRNTIFIREEFPNHGSVLIPPGLGLDNHLSSKAVGLFVRIALLIRTDGNISIKKLTPFCKEGTGAILSGLAELEKIGHLYRLQTHNKDGTFAGTFFFLFENPQKLTKRQLSRRLRKWQAAKAKSSN